MENEEIKVAIIIPSLEPGNRLIQLLENLHETLKKQENSNILVALIIVDDGSGSEYLHLFNKAQEKYNCIILKHAVNFGKGRALKTAFNYYLLNYLDYHGVVTADSDGQHTAQDIIKCIYKLSGSCELILGCRDFNSKNIPFKSLIGNRLTRSIVYFLCGLKVKDTQTGLRAISTEMIKKVILVSGERFEYEMNMLIECNNSKTKIEEVSIETIYLDKNKGTHFNPLLDSIRIYKTFVKYILSAVSSFLLDIGFFAVILCLTKGIFASYILFSTILARIISSFYNYLVNKNIVFSGKNQKSTFLKYYSLAAVIMLVSGVFTALIFNFSFLNEVSSKILIDTVLFLLSYYIQKRFIF
ncbi:MAG: bifunctional glycosyltransferase family 2/GtrA family protein [Oscillospiraceae bacterium]|nr:bifunctional glycosyltransferase family 2/GtrA family protein [Oscillospiraceae bacterium]